MNRRQFLRGFGGLVAVTSLPAFGDDDPSVFPSRGRFERLVLAYQHVHAGATRPFSILHISDTHLTAAYAHEPEVKQKLRVLRTQTFGGRQEEALRDSLAWAKDNVDYVLHTGDLIDWQSEANFDLVRKYVGGLPLGAVGNHEYSPSMWLSARKETPTESYKDPSRRELASVYGHDLSFRAQVVNGVDFVMMDDVYGTVTSDQVERFAAETKRGLPIVLCVHVPFYTDAIRRADCKFWRSGRKFDTAAVPAATGDCGRQRNDPVTRDFIAGLRKEPQLKAILAGHLHLTVQERFSPTAMQYVVGGNFMFHGEEVLFT